MSIYLRLGDCRDVLPTLPDQSVHCCVTSPPYFGLRDYGHPDQIGLEPTPDEYVDRLVAVFREVRRVLQDDGTLWLNLGDSYAQGGSGGASCKSTLKNDGSAVFGARAQEIALNESSFSSKPEPGLKQKDLIGIPWRVAFALQADGWYLRQDIIWHKPNPMPESVTDRCTKAHEYIFLLTKSARYYYDAEAIKEDAVGCTGGAPKKIHDPAAQGRHGATSALSAPWTGSATRNRRSVWTVATQPYSGAHFATFPPKLIEPCILAGCPPGGTVLDPFNGSGTTGEVAIGNARNYIGIELSPEYLRLAEQRLNGAQIVLPLQ